MRLGFTLIELLITIILFSLLLATSLYSFRFISINVHNINNTNPQTAINYSLLRDTIASIYPYVDTDIKEKKTFKRYYFYFYGSEKKCRFITKSGIFYKGITLVELSFKDNILWYKEGKVFDRKKDYRKLNTLFLDKKLKLLVDIEEFSFNYSSKNVMESTYNKTLPKFITLKFKKDKHKLQYIFKLRANNTERLEKIINRYLERK